MDSVLNRPKPTPVNQPADKPTTPTVKQMKVTRKTTKQGTLKLIYLIFHIAYSCLVPNWMFSMFTTICLY